MFCDNNNNIWKLLVLDDVSFLITQYVKPLECSQFEVSGNMMSKLFEVHNFVCFNFEMNDFPFHVISL